MESFNGNSFKYFDVIVIGAGAAGLIAAATAAKREKKVLLIESTNKIGEKIRISGGGRCNFTNLNAGPNNYISSNPHFVKSALARFTQHDFIKLVNEYKISYHEKTLGQLFCDTSSTQIIDMLVNECKKYNVDIILNTKITSLNKSDLFYLKSDNAEFQSESVIIASGGLSIPKIGASGFGYEIAKQFGLNIIPTYPALVPLIVSEKELEFYKQLSGISIDALVGYEKIRFRENILFTHKGMSGPAILQISSYVRYQESDTIDINLLPMLNIRDVITQNRHSKTLVTNFMKEFLPNRFVDSYFEDIRLVDLSNKDIETLVRKIENFQVSISGTEGYLKAEVTKGGVDTKELSSKTMEVNKVPRLFFIGEVVDVTGWLGGYNFQWAWSSGFVAGSYA